MTHHLQPFRNLKHLHIPTASRFAFQRNTLPGSGVVLTRGTPSRTWPVSTTSSLMVPTTDSSEVSRTFSSTLRMCSRCHSWLGSQQKSATQPRCMNKTAAEVAVEIATDAQMLRGLRVLHTVLAANTAGRAKVIAREDTTKNGAWAWAKLHEKFGRDSGATSFTEVFQYSWPRAKPFEDVWREWVEKVSKIPQGSRRSQAIEQLTISGLSRHGQTELENHLRLKAPQTQVEKYLSTIYTQQSPQPMDISPVLTSSKCQSCGSQTPQRNDCWYKDETCKSCGKRGHLTKVCRSGNAQAPMNGSSTGTGKGSGNGSGKSKTQEKDT